MRRAAIRAIARHIAPETRVVYIDNDPVTARSSASEVAPVLGVPE